MRLASRRQAACGLVRVMLHDAPCLLQKHLPVDVGREPWKIRISGARHDERERVLQCQLEYGARHVVHRALPFVPPQKKLSLPPMKDRHPLPLGCASHPRLGSVIIWWTAPRSAFTRAICASVSAPDLATTGAFNCGFGGAGCGGGGAAAAAIT